jgi:hypothetical protein
MQTLGDPNSAAVLAEARTRCDEIGDRSCVSQAWRIRGNAQFYYADFSAAQQAYMNGLAIARELGDRTEIAKILTGLGVVARSRRDWPQAEQTLSEAISLQIETSPSPSEAFFMNWQQLRRIAATLRCRAARSCWRMPPRGSALTIKPWLAVDGVGAAGRAVRAAAHPETER